MCNAETLLKQIEEALHFTIGEMKTSNTTYCTNIMKMMTKEIEEFFSGVNDGPARLPSRPKAEEVESVLEEDSAGGDSSVGEAEVHPGLRPEQQGMDVVPEGAKNLDNDIKLLGPTLKSSTVALAPGQYQINLMGGGKAYLNLPHIFTINDFSGCCAEGGNIYREFRDRGGAIILKVRLR